MLAEGLDPRFVVPVRYLLTGRLPARSRQEQARVERRRREIARLSDTFGWVHVDTPHGPTRYPVERSRAERGPYVSGQWLAHVVAIPSRWGAFLHLCADVTAAGIMLEIGTSVGISAAYLASGRGCRRLMTIEGSPDLSRLARRTLEDAGPRAVVFTALFDEGLDQVFAELDREDTRLALVYLDGHHDERASLHYLHRLLPRLSRDALLILDDIYLYEEMWRVWNNVRTMPGVSAALNLGRVGLLTWTGDERPAAQFDLSRYTGWWSVGGSRHATLLDACARS
jgi:predicted O-methyltransferase YrrM